MSYLREHGSLKFRDAGSSAQGSPTRRCLQVEWHDPFAIEGKYPVQPGCKYARPACAPDHAGKQDRGNERVRVIPWCSRAGWRAMAGEDGHYCFALAL